MQVSNIAAVLGFLALGAGASGALLVSDPLQKTTVVAASQLGAELTGIRATAQFSDGSVATGVFISNNCIVAGQFILGVTAFGGTPDTGAAGTYWSLSNTNPNSRLTSLSLDGRGDGAGLSAFDINGIFYGIGDTPGSNGGIEVAAYQDNLTGPWTADVTYSGAVGLNDTPAVGDLYRFVTISNLRHFNQAGLGLSSEIRFVQDTDFAIVTPVPEPASLAAFALAFRPMGRRRGV
jgi:hypothetical protein